MITLKVNGTEYDNFLSVSCNKSMLEFNSEANFEIALEEGEFPPFLGNERCEVLIDEKKVLTGFIDIISINYSESTHSVNYTIRDKTSDFSDSDIDVINDLGSSISLKRVIEIVLKHLGLDVGTRGEKYGIKVIGSVDDLKPFDNSTDDIAPEVGDNAFEYCEKLARKRQVLLTTDSDGNIEIVRNSGEQLKQSFQNSFNDNNKENNILSASYSYDYTKSFRKYVVKSQLGKANSGAINFGAVSNKNVANQKGFFEDKGIRTGRQKVIIADESANDKDNQERALWQANFQRMESEVHSINVYGHSLGKEIIEPNKLVFVYDDFAEVIATMTIQAVTWEYSINTGSITSVTLTDKDAFTLTVNEPLEETEKEEDNGIVDFSADD